MIEDSEDEVKLDSSMKLEVVGVEVWRVVAVTCVEEETVDELVVSVLAVVDSVEEDEEELEVLVKFAPLVAVILATNHTVSLGNVTKCVFTTVVGT